MTKERYISKKKEIETLMGLENDPEKSDYFHGYHRGLQRNFYGNQFGTQEEHNAWMSQEGSKLQGYLDGLNAT